MEEHGTYRTRTDITLPGAWSCWRNFAFCDKQNEGERERESIKNECILTNNLSMQLFNPIVKTCYVRMLVLSLYLSVKRKRSEPRNHGWKADAFECKPHPAVATPHPDADYLPLLLNSIKLLCCCCCTQPTPRHALHGPARLPVLGPAQPPAGVGLPGPLLPQPGHALPAQPAAARGLPSPPELQHSGPAARHLSPHGPRTHGRGLASRCPDCRPAPFRLGCLHLLRLYHPGVAIPQRRLHSGQELDHVGHGGHMGHRSQLGPAAVPHEHADTPGPHHGPHGPAHPPLRHHRGLVRHPEPPSRGRPHPPDTGPQRVLHVDPAARLPAGRASPPSLPHPPDHGSAPLGLAARRPGR